MELVLLVGTNFCEQTVNLFDFKLDFIDYRKGR